jgi:hypothetical protein
MSASYLEGLLNQGKFGSNKATVRFEISKIKAQLDELQMQERLTNLFSKIENVRQLGYISQTDLEVELIKAAQLWVSIEGPVRDKIKLNVATYREKINNIEADFEPLNKKGYASEDDVSDMDSLRKIIDSCSLEISNFFSQTQNEIDPLLIDVKKIENRVLTIENWLNLVSTDRFKLKANESIIAAFAAKEVKDKMDGVLILTNQRIIFKRLPSQQNEGELVLDRSIDSVAKLTKGKVGLFKSEGLHIEFKSTSNTELIFSFKSGVEETDSVIRYFSLITSGEAETEIRSGFDKNMRRRFKELGIKYFPGVSFSSGICKECGTLVTTPIKTFQPEEGPITGLFSCPDCNKPFVIVLFQQQ